MHLLRTWEVPEKAGQLVKAPWQWPQRQHDHSQLLLLVLTALPAINRGLHFNHLKNLFMQIGSAHAQAVKLPVGHVKRASFGSHWQKLVPPLHSTERYSHQAKLWSNGYCARLTCMSSC